RTNLECFALLTNIELEIHGTHHIRGIRGRGIDRGSTDSFASASLGHPKSFVTPQTLDLLVIVVPALAPGIMIGAPVSPTWMIFGVLAQPGTQRLIRICHGLVVERSAPCRAGQPSQPACHTLTDRKGSK